MSDGSPNPGGPEGQIPPSRPEMPKPPLIPKPPVEVPPAVSQLGHRDQGSTDLAPLAPDAPKRGFFGRMGDSISTLLDGDQAKKAEEVAQRQAQQRALEANRERVQQEQRSPSPDAAPRGGRMDAARDRAENIVAGARDRAGHAAEAARAGAGRVAEVGGAAVGRVAEVATSERGRQVIEAAADLGLSAAERKFETARDRAVRKHGEKIASAKKGFLGRLGWIGVLKTAGLAVADLHSSATVYGVGDVLVAADAARNLYQSTDKNRSNSERDALRKRGVGKLIAAGVPFVPGSLTAPLIDAAIGDGDTEQK